MSENNRMRNRTHPPLRTALALLVLVFSSLAIGDPVDVTTLNLGIAPDDANNDSSGITAALRNYDDLYFPPGIYRLNSTVYLPSDRGIHGAGMTATTFSLVKNTVAFRVEGHSDITLNDFGIDCTFTTSSEEAIYVYPGRTDPYPKPHRVHLNRIRVNNRRSRAPALSFRYTIDCSVRHCETINNMMQIWTPPEPVTAVDPPIAWQVYGSGITFSHSENPIIEYNRIYETDDRIAEILDLPPGPYYQRYFQAGSIQAPQCTNALIQYNWINYAGQGIDTNGTVGALVRGNIIDNCHSHAIKFAHFCRDQRLERNYIKYAGLKGIAFAPGNNEGTVNCTAENNVFVGTGKGIGQGFWNPNGTADYPACIHLDTATTSDPETRSHDNIIRNNRGYDNDQLTTAPQAIGKLVIVRGGPGGAYNTTLENNLLLDGPAPAPDPFLYSASTQGFLYE